MKTTLGVLMLAIWVGAWACGREVAARKNPCEPVQLAEGETALLTTRGNMLYMSGQSDTIRKPYSVCVTLLAADTVRKPT
jgi:hypothetical protein